MERIFPLGWDRVVRRWGREVTRKALTNQDTSRPGDEIPVSRPDDESRSLVPYPTESESTVCPETSALRRRRACYRANRTSCF
jgi:hypothetical protein